MIFEIQNTSDEPIELKKLKLSKIDNESINYCFTSNNKYEIEINTLNDLEILFNEINYNLIINFKKKRIEIYNIDEKWW